MSTIPIIKSVINKTVPQYVVRGTFTINGVMYNGEIVPVVYTNGNVPLTSGVAILTKIEGIWYVLGTIAPSPLKPPVIMWHHLSAVVSGGAIATTVGTNQFYNLYSSQGSIANGNSFTQAVYLIEGEYAFGVYGIKDTNRGKLDWYLDSNLVVSAQDWYAAAIAWNTLINNTIYVPFTGYHELRGVVNTKHASSSNYAQVLTYYSFTPS